MRRLTVLAIVLALAGAGGSLASTPATPADTSP